MKIVNLTEDSKMYTSNVFMVLGTWNTIDDVNTLIDTGCDETIIQKILDINTGLGKRKIDQVILTHSHSDHSGLITEIKKIFNPKVCAFNSHINGIDQILRDGNMLRIGEQQFEVFHITAHSYDSICLYGQEEGILFAGDTTFPIEFENDQLKKENAAVLSRLQIKEIKIVYHGHGLPHYCEKNRFQLIKEKNTSGYFSLNKKRTSENRIDN